MKKLIAIIAVVVCMAAVQVQAFIEGPEITVNLNGEKMAFDAQPFIENDRTLVPMRAIFEGVGARVEWDSDTQTAIAVREKDGAVICIAIQADSPTAFVNENAKTLDTAAKIADNRTFVPLRFVVEELGETVEWNQSTYTVDITTK